MAVEGQGDSYRRIFILGTLLAQFLSLRSCFRLHKQGNFQTARRQRKVARYILTREQQLVFQS